MKIEKVTYQKTYSIAPYLTDRVGFEATPEGKPDEDPKEMLSFLEGMADAWHKKAHPHLYPDLSGIKQDGNETFISKPDLGNVPYSLPIISKDKEKIEIAIDNADTVDELKDVKTVYPLIPASLINHYNKRMQELTAGRPQNFTDGLL